MFNALVTDTTGNLSVAAASGLRFPAHLEALAQRVVYGLGVTFNGWHARIEPDMGLEAEVGRFEGSIGE